MDQKISVGNIGPKVRSDCFVEMEICNSGGRVVEIKSKVDSMFGNSNRKLVDAFLDFYNIQHIKLNIQDMGALPLVLTARLEAALDKLIAKKKEFLPEMIKENTTESLKDQFRFSRLYLPGNTPSMMLNAGIHKPDGIILDLEDSVAPAKKHEARFLVRNVLRGINFYGAERMVRINQLPAGLDDLEYVIPHGVNLLLVPKCESGDQIKQLDEKISELRKKYKLSSPIYYMPIIESALGVEMAYQIAVSSPNIASLAIGLEDYTADLGAKRTKAANESFYARTRMVNACRAAGIQAIDSVFSDVSDMDGLRENVKTSKSLGFEGMGCIHPRQIAVIHESFAPDTEDIAKAKRIVLAFVEADKKGLGVVSLGSKMIDPPVVKRAQKTIDLAMKLELIPSDWMEIELNKEDE